MPIAINVVSTSRRKKVAVDVVPAKWQTHSTISALVHKKGRHKNHPTGTGVIFTWTLVNAFDQFDVIFLLHQLRRRLFSGRL